MRLNLQQLADGTLLMAIGLIIYFGSQALFVGQWLESFQTYSALAALLIIIGAVFIVINRFQK